MAITGGVAPLASTDPSKSFPGISSSGRGVFSSPAVFGDAPSVADALERLDFPGVPVEPLFDSLLCRWEPDLNCLRCKTDGAVGKKSAKPAEARDIMRGGYTPETTACIPDSILDRLMNQSPPEISLVQRWIGEKPGVAIRRREAIW